MVFGRKSKQPIFNIIIGLGENIELFSGSKMSLSNRVFEEVTPILGSFKVINSGELQRGFDKYLYTFTATVEHVETSYGDINIGEEKKLRYFIRDKDILLKGMGTNKVPLFTLEGVYETYGKASGEPKDEFSGYNSEQKIKFLIAALKKLPEGEINLGTFPDYSSETLERLENEYKARISKIIGLSEGVVYE